MATWRVNNSTLLGGEICAPWQANHAYALGARCVCTVAYATTAARAFVYEATDVTDVSGGSQPTWPTTVGNTVVDGGVTWTARSPSDGSWDNASCYLYYVTNHAAAAGDAIYIDDGHSEIGIGAAMTIAGSATVDSPTKVYCVDKASDALSTGAVVASGNQGLRLNGCVYSYGVNYSSGSGQIVFGVTANATWTLEGNNTTVLTCTASTGIAAYYPAYAAHIYIVNAKVYIGERGFDAGNFGLLRWKGGAVDTGGSGSTCFYYIGSNKATAIFEDVDLSDLGKGASAAYLFDMDNQTGVSVQFLRCKLPDDAGFVISRDDADYYNSGKAILHHCSSANQTYDFYERSYEGTVEDNTSIYRTGGASDGTTAISAKMVSSSGCVENIIALESPPIHAWTSSTTSKTFAIEGIWDSAANIQDDEIWMELEYPANATDGLGAIAKDKCVILGTPADQTVSSETWSPSTEGMDYSVMFAPTSMTANNLPSPYVAAASSEYSSSYYAYNAFDGDDATRWSTAKGVAAAIISIDLGTTYNCGGYSILDNYADTASCPSDWTFEGSENGSNWTVLDTQTNQTSGGGSYLTYELATHGVYRHFRLNITNNNGGVYTEIRSIKLFASKYLANPNKFKLSVTVTPGKAGPITARVCLAKPSTIVYIDPKITES